MRISSKVSFAQMGYSWGVVARNRATIFASAGFSQTKSPRVLLHSQRH